MKRNGFTVPLLHIHHPQDNLESLGYFRLSQHFKWALNQVKITNDINNEINNLLFYRYSLLQLKLVYQLQNV